MNDSDLLPCMKCYGECQIVYYKKGSGGLPVQRVRCKICKIQGPIRRGDAVEHWNTRARPARSSDAVALAEKLMDIVTNEKGESYNAISPNAGVALLEAFRHQIWAEAIELAAKAIEDVIRKREPSVYVWADAGNLAIEAVKALTSLERKE